MIKRLADKNKKTELDNFYVRVLTTILSFLRN